MAAALYIATLVIYIVLLQPTLFCLWRHGWPGFLGWLSLQMFCLIRIVGSALEIHESSSGTTSEKTLIVNNIGLSPLLLAVLGILHEARRARNPHLKARREWFVVIQYHFLIMGALGMIIAGIVILEGGNPTSAGRTVLRIGAALLLVDWAALFVWVIASLQSEEIKRLFVPLRGGPLGMLVQSFVSAKGHSQNDTGAQMYADGSKLLYAVLFSIVLLALRVAYSVGNLIIDADQKHSIFASSLAIKVILSVVPEMVVTVALCCVGIATRNIPGAYWSRQSERTDDRIPLGQ